MMTSPAPIRRRSGPWRAALALTVLLASSEANAQSRAQDLFREGREAAVRGDWAGACAKFEESFSYESSIGAIVNLGECNERQGKLTAALSFWRKGLERMPPDDARRDLANQNIAELEKRTPKIVVQASGSTRVFVDGQAALPGQPWLVDPGAHRVVLLADDEPARTIDFTIREGELLPIGGPATTPPAVPAAIPPAAPAAKSPAAAPTPTPEAAEVDNPLLVPAVVAYGVAGAGLVAFAVTGGLFMGELSTYDDECDDSERCSPAGIAAGDRGFTYGVVNAISLGVTVLGAGVGTTLLIVGAEGEPEAVEARVRGASFEVVGRF